MQETTLLTYNLEGQRQTDIEGLARALGVTVKAVPATAQDVVLETLLGDGGEASHPEKEAAFEEEMLVMCHFPRPLFNALLDGFHEKGISPISLMAVLTPTNSGWTSRALHDELCKERDYFLRRQAQADAASADA